MPGEMLKQTFSSSRDSANVLINMNILEGVLLCVLFIKIK
jgi:hypothetical protein